ncbi:MAG: bifunctional adenosylcobinamide kinase/adenosylcobinamide-phosphate guanylyltransferase [Pseudobutyrivibrio sp.]|nr:bifunctional adenosylcobinamide kinase/adenosylcobinamide-phosphate guanylyltransferase [Pseudobutyrivibrio sp.]
MITLVYGGSSSGKSGFAEDLVCHSTSKNKYYLATMGVRDEESVARIERHRQIRAGKGFVTLEHERDVYNAIPEIESIDLGDFSTDSEADGTIVLLECMSNLVANEMFRDGEIYPAEQVVNKILGDIEELAECVSSMVIVSNNVFEDGIDYDPGTQEYLKALGMINRAIAKLSDDVYEVVVGIGIKL